MTSDEYLAFVLDMYRAEHPGITDFAIHRVMVQELGPSAGVTLLMAAKVGAQIDDGLTDEFKNRDSGDFLRSFEWRRLRWRVLEKRGARCEKCGRTAKDGIIINVDHIQNRKQYPELALTESNLQVLCNDCNHGKGNLPAQRSGLHDHRV